MDNDPDKTNRSSDSSSNPSNTASASEASKGFEIDEQRPYGQNSGRSRQGGPLAPEIDRRLDNNESQEGIDATHIGKTQSTTNSQ